jgi:hemolysin-activating ACP:hemolysin acyltransferase
MPQMVVQLAKSAKESVPLLAFQEVPGGWTFKQHVSKGKVAELLKSAQWNYVVLQEQSQFLSFSHEQRLQDVHPAARQMNTMIYNNHAKPILFMTWGYRDGDLMNRQSDSYPDMQNRIALGYTELAKDLSATIAPVGLAWQQAIARRPDLNLWDVDGKHPNLKGSYLAACMFYGLIYHKSPLNNPFRANLDPVDAYFLQSVAESNLPDLPPLNVDK